MLRNRWARLANNSRDAAIHAADLLTDGSRHTFLKLFSIALRGANSCARSFFIILFSLSLASCTRITTEDLRKQSANSDSFRVDKNYQFVYHKILNVGRECHERLVWGLYPIPNRMTVEGHLNNEVRTANVTVVLHSGMIKNITTISLMTVDISAIDQSSTNVIVYAYAGTGWDKGPINAVRGWVLQDSKECSLP